MQSRWGSFAESVANIAIGFAISLAAQVIIFPMFGLYASHRDHLLIGLCFTVVSLARSYMLRRLFNSMHARSRQ